MTKKKEIKNSYQELDLPLCEKVIHEHSAEVFYKFRYEGGRYDETSLQRAFRVGIQFVGCCWKSKEGHIHKQKDRYGNEIFVKSHLADAFLFDIPAFALLSRTLSTEFIYHEYITVLQDCCNKNGLTDESYAWSTYWLDASHIYPCNKESEKCISTFNQLVDLIIESCRNTQAARRLGKRTERIKKQYKEYCNYIDFIFNEHRARLVVLRIDLEYQKSVAQSVTFKEAKADVDCLLNNRRHNSLFESLVGYVIKTEYGIEKGIHFHVILFFDGSIKYGPSHINLTMRIGEYWTKTIAPGRGYYWNVNNNIDDFISLNRCGIGVIEWHDDDLRHNLKEHVLGYMMKSTQFIRPKIGASDRLVSRGKYPKVPEVKRGRKRGNNKKIK